MLYYIIHKEQQVGPMPKEELVNYGLTPASKVCAVGGGEWVEASSVAELQVVLYSRPVSPYKITQNKKLESMNFLESVQKCIKNYVTFSGRARRSEYWWFALACSAVIGVVGLFSMLVSAIIPFFGILLLPIMLILAVGLMIPQLAVGARRLHDTGRSGWWLLLPITCIGIIFLIMWLCEDSAEGENEYGPNPKEGE